MMNDNFRGNFSDAILLNVVARKSSSVTPLEVAVAVVWYNKTEGYIVRFFDTYNGNIENFKEREVVIYLGADAPGGIVYSEDIVVSQGSDIKVYTLSRTTVIEGTYMYEASLVTKITFGQRGDIMPYYLTGLAFNSKGHLVVAESNYGSVYVLDYESSLQAKHPVTISIINGLKSPRCVACTVYFGDKDVIAVADKEKIGFYFCYEDSKEDSPQVIEIPTVEQDVENGVTGAASQVERIKIREQIREMNERRNKQGGKKRTRTRKRKQKHMRSYFRDKSKNKSKKKFRLKTNKRAKKYNNVTRSKK